MPYHATLIQYRVRAPTPLPTIHKNSGSENLVRSSRLRKRGVFTAAQKALPSFRHEIHRENPKLFIMTGNILPFSQYSPPRYHTLGLQKALQTRFFATAAKAYESENFQ